MASPDEREERYDQSKVVCMTTRELSAELLPQDLVASIPAVLFYSLREVKIFFVTFTIHRHDS